MNFSSISNNEIYYLRRDVEVYQVETEASPSKTFSFKSEMLTQRIDIFSEIKTTRNTKELDENACS